MAKMIQITLPAVTRVAVVNHHCPECIGDAPVRGIRLALEPPGEVAISLDGQETVIAAQSIDHVLLWSLHDMRHFLATALTLLDHYHED